MNIMVKGARQMKISTILFILGTIISVLCALCGAVLLDTTGLVATGIFMIIAGCACAIGCVVGAGITC